MVAAHWVFIGQVLCRARAVTGRVIVGRAGAATHILIYGALLAPFLASLDPYGRQGAGRIRIFWGIRVPCPLKGRFQIIRIHRPYSQFLSPQPGSLRKTGLGQ